MPRSPVETGSANALRSVFERAAPDYDRHAALEREVADRLLERTAFQRADPLRILDLGCGTGYCTAALKRQHRKAQVIGLDFALAMCRRAKARSALFRPLQAVCGEAAALPFPGRSIDLVVANLVLQWETDLFSSFNELRRIMRPKGLLLFTCLGPASMGQLRAACEAVLPAGAIRPFPHPFPDMHDIGDALVAAGFDEPVMDGETLTLAYPSVEALLTELEATGAASHFDAWPAIREAAPRLAAAWPGCGDGGRIPLGWEIVYGAAFGPAEGRPVKTPEGDIATFSVDALRGARRRH